jgi:superfamily II RNA helicase
MDYEQKIKPDGYIRLDKKTEKKYKKLIGELKRKIPANNYNLLVQYHNSQHEYEKIDSEILFSKIRWDSQIKWIQEFLKENGFIQALDPIIYSEKGVILGEIHDGNPMLMAELLTMNLLDDLEAPILVAMLSLFVVDKEREKILVSDLGLSGVEVACIHKIEEICHKGQTKELEFIQRLPFPFSNDWEISKTMYQAIKDWFQGLSWNEIRLYYGDFEGNFIKNILRLANYIQTILNVAKLVNNVPLQQKLENAQEKLVRDIVMNDSLYITSG